MSRYDWKPEYDVEVETALSTYYSGSWSNITAHFPCLRDSYPWGKDRPDVPDSRVPAKNNTEYHGLETYANQYHACAMYAQASSYWFLAAGLRKIQMDSHSQLKDTPHTKAMQYALKQALYNKALCLWQKKPSTTCPQAKDFDLSPDDLTGKIKQAETKIESHKAKMKLENPVYSSSSTFGATTASSSGSTSTSIFTTIDFKKT